MLTDKNNCPRTTVVRKTNLRCPRTTRTCLLSAKATRPNNFDIKYDYIIETNQIKIGRKNLIYLLNQVVYCI
jgi:hypothetical protein